ncbi:hypothetical protein [Streptomyces sp. NPDC058739]|uniref:hypothetical protein n=1 Tax=Streptomyces sp. NPDC058739 TaxID=3346618 RepID=UPI0036A15772
MSEHRQPDNGLSAMNAASSATGGYDVHAAHEVPDVPPNVYHPQGTGSVPAYDGYADPAAAHGWQNAYDETAPLPLMADPAAYPGYEPGPASAPPPGGHRRSRRAATRRRDRRVLGAAGALGVVSLAAIVAGLSFSGPSEDESGGPKDRTGATAEDSAGPEATPSGTGQGGPSVSAAPGEAPSASPTPTATATTASPRPTATAATSAPAQPTPTGGSAQDGNSDGDDKPGRGLGRPRGSQ